MMTLEEAIKHCKDVALSCTNKECALEHFQLLKWLQEYSNMLEKQCEQKSIDNLSPQEAMDIAVAKCFEQGEQTPVIEMKTPEESLGIDSDTYNKIVDECVYGEQKSVWSEDDEEILKIVIKSCEQCGDKYAYYWLKSLKDRVQSQPKQEWNGEDEIMLRRCISATFDHGYLKECDWLKSLKPQNTWKPSDEQIGALWDSIKHTLNLHPVLKSLYNDLKKLREE